MTRKTKTPQQRAQEQLDAAVRVAKKVRGQWQKAHDDAERLVGELEAAEARRDYLAKHPDLKPNPGTSTTRSSTQAGARA